MVLAVTPPAVRDTQPVSALPLATQTAMLGAESIPELPSTVLTDIAGVPGILALRISWTLGFGIWTCHPSL